MNLSQDRRQTKPQFGQMPGGDIPAAWWHSTTPEIVAAYEQWKTDYDATRAEVFELAKSLGIEDEKDVRVWRGGKTTCITGFMPTREHRREGPPEGWRIDSKSGYLKPVRKTKKDRESDANKQFNRFARIPNALAYVDGLPENCFIPAGGGSSYIMSPQLWQSGDYVCAYLAGDPDRCDEKWPIDETIWQRGSLDLYRELRDACAKARGDHG